VKRRDSALVTKSPTKIITLDRDDEINGDHNTKTLLEVILILYLLL
jgi:hypothetical protein